MDWLTRSPDLNPIENVWDFLGRRLAARTLPPVTIRELRLALQDEWAAMPQQLIDTLILSMGKRCETCLASARRVARQLGHSDCVVRRNGTSGSERCYLHEDQAQDDFDRPVVEKTSTSTYGIRVPIACATPDAHPATPPFGVVPCTRSCTAAKWNQVVLSDKSRFSLSSDDNRVRVWRPHGERLNPAFALQQHTASTAAVMVWGGIACNSRSPPVLISDTMTAQVYVHEILQLFVLPFMQWLPGSLFQRNNAWLHTARVSQDCLPTVTTLPWIASSPDLSLIEPILFGMVSWASHEFERTMGKVTANMERNVLRHHTERVCLHGLSYHVHLR
ncbi:transposable element Tcb1 transposase [Trichonephila clavipes]|nr:transposable element Tcb1 transposase [Trichonephila clavipes]